MKPIIFITSLLLLNTMINVAQAAACPTTGQVMAVATTITNTAVRFKGLAANQWVSVGGLTLTAPNPGLYNQPNKVAAEFANHLNGVHPNNNFGTTALSGWNSGAASGPRVTFTPVDNTNQNTPAISSSSPEIMPTVSTSIQILGNGITLSTLLVGNTVCVGSAGLWQAQEYHKAPSGAQNNLIDYHHGNGSTTDPTAPVGSWSITGNTVNYTYHGSSTYTDTVYDNGNGTYTFCDSNGNTTIASAIKAGPVGC